MKLDHELNVVSDTLGWTKKACTIRALKLLRLLLEFMRAAKQAAAVV